MKSVLAMSQVTFREGLRNRAIYGIFLVALFVMIANALVAGFFMRDIGKVSVDMNLSALSFCGLLMVFFIAINLLAKDIDKKTIHIVLTLPFSRGKYLLGKFLGLAAVLLCAELILVVMASLTIFLLQFMYVDFFAEFSWIAFYQAAGFILVKLWLLTAVVILFSTLSSNSFITLVFSVMVYLAGEMIEEVVFYLKAGSGFDFLPVPEFFLKIVTLVSFIIPNLSVFDIGVQAAHGMTLSGGDLFYPIAYGLIYSSILLIIASWIFARREFN